MYECPNEDCDSRRFRRVVKQEEVVTSDGGGGILHITSGDVHAVSLVECDECGTEVTA